jgi:hypothetical protein
MESEYVNLVPILFSVQSITRLEDHNAHIDQLFMIGMPVQLLILRGSPDRRSVKKKVKAAGKFPCRHVLGCGKVYYKTPGGANRHMRKDHPGIDLEPYPDTKTISRSDNESSESSDILETSGSSDTDEDQASARQHHIENALEPSSDSKNEKDSGVEGQFVVICVEKRNYIACIIDESPVDSDDQPMIGMITIQYYNTRGSSKYAPVYMDKKVGLEDFVWGKTPDHYEMYTAIVPRDSIIASGFKLSHRASIPPSDILRLVANNRLQKRSKC